MQYSANTIADVGYQYEHYTGKLWDRDKCVAKHFSVIRRGKKSEAVDGTHVRLAVIPSEKGDLVRWRLGSIEVNQHEKVRWFRRHKNSESVFHVDGKSNKSMSHSARSSQDDCNPGRYCSVFPQRHG